MGVDIRSLLLYTVLLSGCSTVDYEPDSLSGMKHEAKMSLKRHCTLNPEKYGYPSDLQAYYNLMRIGMTITPNPAQFCRQVAENKVR